MALQDISESMQHNGSPTLRKLIRMAPTLMVSLDKSAMRAFLFVSISFQGGKCTFGLSVTSQTLRRMHVSLFRYRRNCIQ